MEVAFGLTRFLREFKELVPQADSYIDLGLDPLDPEFGAKLLSLMRSASRIHFYLKRMRNIQAVLHDKEPWPVGSTNWELRTIWDTPEFRSKTIFYLNRQIISAEEVLRLP